MGGSLEHGQVQTRLDHHAHQLLHQELAGVGDPHLANVFAGGARLAVVLLLLDVGFAEETTRGAHVHAVAVTHVEQALLQEAARAVTNHAVALHLAETKTAVSRPTLGRLSCQDLGRASGPRVDLITYHMLQALVIGRTQEDHHLKLLACEPIVHHFIAVPLIAKLVELRANVVNSLVLERRRVTFVTIQRCDLTQNTFNQMTNRHTRRDSVRVHDHVGDEAFNSER